MKSVPLLLIIGAVTYLLTRTKGLESMIVKPDSIVPLKQGGNVIRYDGPALNLTEALSNIGPLGQNVVDIVWATQQQDPQKGDWTHYYNFRIPYGDVTTLERGWIYAITVTRDIVWTVPQIGPHIYRRA